MASMVNCPFCGKLTDPNLEGCPHCGGNLQKAAAPKSKSPRSRHTCPSCKAAVQEGDIICVVCGTNLLTGQKINEESKVRQSSDTNAPLLIGGGLVALLLVVAGGLWIYVAGRDPYNQALKLIEEQQYLEAQDKLSEYVVNVPTDEQALYELGRLQWRNNLYGQAAETFERVVSLNPTHTQASFWAIACLELSGGSSARARQIAQLDHIVRANPDNGQAWYLLALARGTQNDIAGQIQALETVLRLDVFLEPTVQALAVAFALQGDYAASERNLKTAATMGNSADVLALSGFVSSLQGKKDDAINSFEKAASAEDLSFRWEALTQLGKLKMEQGKFREATRNLDEAMALHQGNHLAQFLHATSLQAVGYLQDALNEFEILARDRNPFSHDAAVQVADIYLRLDNVDRARQAIDQAGSIGTQGAPYFTVRGRMFAKKSDDVAAQDSFKRATNADPGYAPAYLENGLLYVKREALDEGLRQLDTYLELLGPDAIGPRIDQIRELTNQIRQTTSAATTT